MRVLMAVYPKVAMAFAKEQWWRMPLGEGDGK